MGVSMKRKIKTQHITLRVNVALVKALKRRARREGVTMTDLIGGALAVLNLEQSAAPKGGAQ